MSLPDLITEARSPGFVGLTLDLGDRVVRVMLDEAAIYQPNRLQEIVGAMAERLKAGGGDQVNLNHLTVRLAVFDSSTRTMEIR